VRPKPWQFRIALLKASGFRRHRQGASDFVQCLLLFVANACAPDSEESSFLGGLRSFLSCIEYDIPKRCRFSWALLGNEREPLSQSTQNVLLDGASFCSRSSSAFSRPLPNAVAISEVGDPV
jgi:hypothetical protein